MSVRYTLTFATSANDLPAALRSVARFWKIRSVWAATPPSMSFPVAGSGATCPLVYTRSPSRTAGENGPTGLARRSDTIGWIGMVVALGESGRLLECVHRCNARRASRGNQAGGQRDERQQSRDD